MFRDALKIAVISLGILATAIVVRGEDPTPAEPVAFTASANVTGTGKRSDPFMFDVTTKPVLKLTGAAADLQWDTEDGPADIEAIGNVLVFSVAEPGEYVVFATWTGGKAKAWFRIGPRGPPAPVDQITSRVRAALTGHVDDAKVFATACDALAASLEADEIKTLGAMEDALAAGLKANKWPQGKYPDLSKLAGELFGSGVPDGPIDAAAKSRFIADLKTISKACGAVK